MDQLEKIKMLVRADALDSAAFEAGKERIMILTKENIEDGMLDDQHPVIRARKQMRNEIVRALSAMADACRAAASTL